jgi:hypothetical protein
MREVSRYTKKVFFGALFEYNGEKLEDAEAIVGHSNPQKRL